MNKPSKKFTQAVVIIFAAWIISIGIIYIKAWVGPTSAPATEQGALAVDGSGNVGIGTTSPDGRLDVEGGDVFIGTGTLDNGTGSEDLLVTGNIEVDGAYYGDGSNLTGITTTGVWKLIYENDVASAVSSITVSGLDGDTDVAYKIIGRFKGSTTFRMRPNGLTSNFVRHMSITNMNNGNTAYYRGGENGIIIGQTTLATDPWVFSKLVFYAKTGYMRFAFVEAMSYVDTSGYVDELTREYSTWTDTSTNVTSLVFVAEGGGNFDPGSHIEVWARR